MQRFLPAERKDTTMLRFFVRRWKRILPALVLLIAGSSLGLAFALHPWTSSTPRLSPQVRATPTSPPACVQLPQQLDWQHLSKRDFAKYGLPQPPTSLTDLSQWVVLMHHLKRRSCTLSLHPPIKIHATAQSQGGQQAQSCPTSRNCENPTWAGGIASEHAYRLVQATWTLPCLQQGVKKSSSSAWVGLGGVESSAALVQAGIDNDVDAEGQVVYTAWAESYTPPSATSPFHDDQADLIFSQGLHCGDRIYVQVSSDVSGKVDRDYPDTFFVGNMTTGEYQYYNPSWRPSDGSTAEWIVEQPTFVSSQGLSLKPLANFGTLTFAFCLAYGEDQGLQADDNLPLHLVSLKGRRQLLAIPEAPSPATIAVQWVRSG